MPRRPPRSKHRTRGPKPIADVLAELMARRGYGRVKSDQSLAVAWSETVDESFPAAGRAFRSHAGPIRRGVLDVVLDNSTAVQELQFQKHKLLAGLTARLPELNLRDIRFRVGTVAADGSAPPRPSAT